ncbi:MAG: DUF5916 domain-containing protein [Cytophagales bacterium]|nr:carbohydrate binding family 9 domain-containing protein [Bernardetiaceae bacterium]MDW8211540.1 DUF5916 domain-containing protein [Cytophagales bacterium]
MKNIFLIATLLAAAWQTAAQTETVSLTAKYTDEKIVIDGKLDEPVWQTAEKITNFWQYFPTDSVKARNQTQARVLYNDEAIYIGILAHTSGNRFVINSLRRDFMGAENDNVALVFDTFSDGNTAYLFSASPYGVQREALVADGGANRESFNLAWDMKWQVESTRGENFYILEIAIPFSSMKFPEGSQKWRFQVFRWDLQSNEQSAWSRVPQNQLLANLAFMGELIFEKPLGKSRPPIYLIPYVNGLSAKDFQTEQAKTTNKFSTGVDAKVAIGNGMNLDITLNPDFSNVEVDNIVTNLTRFEIFLPERRQFFIDNNDLFGNFGDYFATMRTFFSRRIGIITDTIGRTVENRILGGFRLSGKLNNNWRLGAMSIQTAQNPANRIASNNNSMIVLQRKVFSRSNVGAFVISREAFYSSDFQSTQPKYNRVIGMDYNLASKDNTWNGKFFLHKSFQPDDKSGNLAAQATLTYNTRFWNLITDWLYVDKDFRSDLGFIPRTDFFRLGNSIAHTFYPTRGIINRHTPRIVYVQIFSPSMGYQRTDQFVWASYNFEFRNQATVELRYTWDYVYLTFPFDPSRTYRKQPLPAGTDYSYSRWGINFNSNPTKKFVWSAGAATGQFYNGIGHSFNLSAGLRLIPYAQVSLTANYDKIILPEPHASSDMLIISPRMDITFSKSLFWSTLVQYATQRNNLGINSRLQWRFAPLSDLFVVYNDNYFAENFAPRFRSINLKFTYWFGI